ncbi:MAG: hypothetical protein H6745_19025 [Deltaproteobacteria bacterium]|nr:hypothetical protein [Deltaproteobacteria bacterium]
MLRHIPFLACAALAVGCDQRETLPEGASCFKGNVIGSGGAPAGAAGFKDCGPGMYCRWEDTTCYRWRTEGEACGGLAQCKAPLACVVDEPGDCAGRDGDDCSASCRPPIAPGPPCASHADCAEGACAFDAAGAGRCYVGDRYGSPCNVAPFAGLAPDASPAELAAQCEPGLLCGTLDDEPAGAGCDPDAPPPGGCRRVGVCQYTWQLSGACWSQAACDRGEVCRTPEDPPLRYDADTDTYAALPLPESDGGACVPEALPARGEPCIGLCRPGLLCMLIPDDIRRGVCTAPGSLRLGERCYTALWGPEENPHVTPTEVRFCAAGTTCDYGPDNSEASVACRLPE